MKLDQIEKKNIFEVPDGYFDKLPLAIQARVAAKEKKPLTFPTLAWSFKLALPVIFFGVASIFVYQNYRNQSNTPENLLEDVNTETLISYLRESEISEDEILETVAPDQVDFQDIQNDSNQNIEITNSQLDRLSKEIENEYF